MQLFNEFKLGQLDGVGRSVVDDMYKQRPDWTVASISEFDAAFFAGLAMTLQPKKVVEVGVASGWGSVILLEALNRSNCTESKYFGVDIAPRFFYDNKYATGQAVDEVVPNLAPRYELLTGSAISEVATKIGGDIDFAFIDAHHMHPWATLDLLSLLPFLKANSWVALHDLNLCRKEDQEHKNRGPKYLFEGWEEDKAHSIQNPTMAGAVRIGSEPISHLPLLLDILYTPWEIAVEERFLNPLLTLISEHYGTEWAMKFTRAAEVGNYHANKMHSHDIDALSAEIVRLRATAKSKISRVLARIMGR